MISMDVFRGDAFSAVSLTGAVDKYNYVPGFLGSIPNLFVPVPIRTDAVWIEERSNAPALIQTSPRGAPPTQKGGDNRKARSFKTTRIADSSRIWGHELQGIRSFGEEQALKSLQEEVARRQMKMKQDMDLTKEHMRLGCVQGLVVDADGSTLFDWAAEFGQSIPSEVSFTSGILADVGQIITTCNAIRRQTARNLKGVGGAAVTVHALCSDSFWDAFTTSAGVRTTYQYAMAATALQNNVGGAWESFRFGQIMWHNYRGTDDTSTVTVPDQKVKFFPVGAGIFQVAQSPAEKIEFLNTLGQENYSWIVPDRDRDMWADVEQYSYPLHVCTMPSALGSGTLA